MHKQNILKKKLRCKKCGSWMFPISITVWEKNSIHKTFRCKKCHQETRGEQTHLLMAFDDGFFKNAKMEDLK